MSVELYYTAPPDEVFDEIKAAALLLWRSYTDPKFDVDIYVAEKVGRVEPVTNVEDNWMYLVAMFDSWNQHRLFRMLRPETVALILEAIAA